MIDEMKLRRLVKDLRAENNIGYGTKPLLSPTDNQILELLLTLKANNPSETSLVIRNLLDASNFPVFLAFAERMATFAIRQSEIGFVKDSLIALALVYQYGDLRESVPILSLLRDACLRLHADPREIFTSVRIFYSPEVENIFLRFLKRSEEDKSIESMGYVFTPESGGTYSRTW